MTLVVTDGTLTGQDTFVLTVTSVNDLPTISAIADQTIDEDTSTAVLPFTISDVETVFTCGDVAKASTLTSLIPNANIVI